MQLLIQEIEKKNNWGKNELSLLLSKTSSNYARQAMASTGALSECVKENMVCDTINHVLVKIQEKTSWGKNVILDMIFKKMVEEVSS